jgi:hypothetical protein
MKELLKRLENTEWVFEPKPLFDHIRNYGIAGAIAISAFVFYEKFPFEPYFVYFLFSFALVLTILNALSGVTFVFRWFRINNFPLSTRIVAALTYCLLTFAVCIALIEATVQK